MLFQFGNKQYGIPMTYNKCKFNHLDAGIRFAIFDFNGYYIKSQVIFYNPDGTNKTLLSQRVGELKDVFFICGTDNKIFKRNDFHIYT